MFICSHQWDVGVAGGIPRERGGGPVAASLGETAWRMANMQTFNFNSAGHMVAWRCRPSSGSACRVLKKPNYSQHRVGF